MKHPTERYERTVTVTEILEKLVPKILENALQDTARSPHTHPDFGSSFSKDGYRPARRATCPPRL